MSGCQNRHSILVFESPSIMLLLLCLNSLLWCVVIWEWLMVKTCYWIAGTAQEGLSFGGYMLHYIHCLFVYFLRERIHTARQQAALLANFHDFGWFPVLLLPLPCSIFKTCSECKLVFFSFVCFVLQFVKSKDSQRVLCLERDVYCLYVA